MPYKIGLVGIPNVGKSTLFNFLTSNNALVANYPFATITPNVGSFFLTHYDSRLQELSKFGCSIKKTGSVLEIIDIAGLIKGASEGKGLGNEFLSQIGSVDLVCYVVRGFMDTNIINTNENINPKEEYKTLKQELILSDYQLVQKQLTKINKTKVGEIEILKKISNQLENELPIFEYDPNILNKYNLLSAKPNIVLINCDSKKEIGEFNEYLKQKKVFSFNFDFKLQSDINDLTLEEKKELGINSINLEPWCQQIIKALNLKTFYTVGVKETKSWLAPEKWTAYDCAALIHSDIQKNFICVEIYNFLDCVNYNNLQQLKENGKIRKEKSDYVIKDGDVCLFIFGKNKK